MMRAGALRSATAAHRKAQDRADALLAARDKVIAAHLADLTHAQIAAETGLSAGTINRVAVLARKAKS